MFHRHHWEAREAKLYLCSTIAWRDRDSEVTLILYECRTCGSHKTEQIDGYWTPQELGIQCPESV